MVASLDPIDAQRHGDGDLFAAGDIVIGRLGAGLDELEDLVDEGRAKPDIHVNAPCRCAALY